MKFIRREQITTTLFDKEISDESDMNVVFEGLYSKNIDFSMIIKKLNINNNDYQSLSFDNVRITKINKENKTIDIIFFKNNIKTVMKNISIFDVSEINSIIKKHKSISVNNSGTRWEIMDI